MHSTDAITGSGSTAAPSPPDLSSYQPTSTLFSSVEASLLPTGTRSLSHIALQAFLLGLVLALSLTATITLLLHDSPLWRAPLFLSLLATFHFLEFYTTAHYSTPAALASSFLLYSNGRAWPIACSAGLLEILITTPFPGWQTALSRPWLLVCALVVAVAGQALRSAAMATAGTNFSHIPARAKREGHVLVTDGVYAFVRHPSYAGFFWWAVAGQVLVGNKLCAAGYAVVLWRFFRARIEGEEGALVQFFGQEYRDYRARTGTWIPLIR